MRVQNGGLDSTRTQTRRVADVRVAAGATPEAQPCTHRSRRATLHTGVPSARENAHPTIFPYNRSTSRGTADFIESKADS